MGEKTCTPCMRKWLDIRKKSYDIVVSEMGPQSNENSKQFIKRVKQLEKQFNNKTEL